MRDGHSWRELADAHQLILAEDAAQALNASCNNQALGTIGNLGAFSFHQTKNYSCGEGGALCINDESLIERAEIIREKGTNRSQFLKGHVDKYTLVDRGSSYLPSELSAVFLFGQLRSDRCDHRIAAAMLPAISGPIATVGRSGGDCSYLRFPNTVKVTITSSISCFRLRTFAMRC